MEQEQTKGEKVLTTLLAILVILYSGAVVVLVPAACIKYLFFN